MCNLRIARRSLLFCARILPVLLLSLTGCHRAEEALATENHSDPQWIEPRNSDAHVAVVFVHGLFGDTLKTWASPSTDFFELLQKDPEIGPNIDIFAFGFTSNFLRGGSLAIDEAANLLYARLENEGVLKYPSLIFVNHSMGGLVVMRMLVQREDVRERTPELVLFGTPTEGSQVAIIASHIAHNPALKDMLPADSNSFLRSLDGDFKAMLNKPRVWCGYEKLGIAGVTVVPWSSATRPCDSSLAISANHFDIVKPDRPKHDSFMIVQRALRQLLTPCRHATHGIEGYASSRPVTKTSNWMGPGYSQGPWCEDVINSLKGEYPAGKFTRLTSSEDKRSRCEPFNCPEYKYTCTVQVETDAIYKNQTSNACARLAVPH